MIRALLSKHAATALRKIIKPATPRLLYFATAPSAAFSLLKLKLGKDGNSSQDAILNFDLNLQEACKSETNSEKIIVDLMDVLKERIVEICEEYKLCLRKQVEIIEDASEMGIMSMRWDDLPEYRSLANELNEELTNFVTILNTLGQIGDESLNYITCHKRQIELIKSKRREVVNVLEAEVVEITKVQKALLDITRKAILKSK